jgi:hypothetical protein
MDIPNLELFSNGHGGRFLQFLRYDRNRWGATTFLQTPVILWENYLPTEGPQIYFIDIFSY